MGARYYGYGITSYDGWKGAGAEEFLASGTTPELEAWWRERNQRDREAKAALAKQGARTATEEPMALRGVKPKAVEKRLKGLLYGPAGVGKTTVATQFPRPYLIDTERGAVNEQYVKALEAAGGAYFFTADFDEILVEVGSLLSEKHDYRTLVIDPLTVPYNDLCDKEARHLAAASKEAGSDGTEFGRHKQRADRKVKRLLNLLLRLDMNVIITSHSKTKWEKSGDSFKEAGTTFDCYGKLDYLFDLVFEIQKRGQERVGIVRKTRVAAFPEGDVFPFNYPTIAERYGHDILERQAEALKLATPERVAELERLVDLLKIPEATVDKWLTKADADTLAEMPEAAVEKCIAMLQAKVSGAPSEAA